MKWVIKVESDLLDISHIRGKAKLNEHEQPIVVIQFTLKKPIAPEEAVDAAKLIQAYVKEFVKPDTTEVVVLSGRGPIWLYGMLQHLMQHVVPALAVFDPKVGGAVVVASHRYDMPNEGAILVFDPELRSRLTQ